MGAGTSGSGTDVCPSAKSKSPDDSLPAPHLLVGQVYSWRKQYEQAIAETERALALDPNDSVVHIRLGSILYFAGRPTEGIEVIEKAMRLNPHYPAQDLINLGMAYRLAGRYEDAVVTFKSALTRNSNLMLAHFWLADLYSQFGREKEAQAEMAEFMLRNPDYTVEVFRQRFPLKDQATLDRITENVRKAGLK